MRLTVTESWVAPISPEDVLGRARALEVPGGWARYVPDAAANG